METWFLGLFSLAQSIFDSLGISFPVTIIPKFMLQESWNLGFKWEDALPEGLSKRFWNWLKGIKNLSEVKIPRWMKFSPGEEETVSLHVFCDVSAKAYATCIFLRVEVRDGPSVSAKPGRLAPDRLKIAKAEFQRMIHLGHMRPSKSAYSSPLHMVPKKGSIESYLENLQENLGKAHGIAMENAEKNQQNMQEDKTCEHVRRPSRLANYYRDYIPNFSSLVLPLTNLTKKNVPNKISWAKEQEQAFQILKEELVKMPSLYNPQLDKPFQLYTDASATAVGACLAQIGDDGKEKTPLHFQQEIDFQLKHGLGYYRERSLPRTGGHEEIRHMDNMCRYSSYPRPQRYLTQQTPHSAKLTQCSLALQRYDVIISYRKGDKDGYMIEDRISIIELKGCKNQKAVELSWTLAKNQESSSEPSTESEEESEQPVIPSTPKPDISEREGTSNNNQTSDKVIWERRAVPRKDKSRTDIYYYVQGSKARLHCHKDVVEYYNFRQDNAVDDVNPLQVSIASENG
ncbi:Retrovirus-related Pol polyprotein like [Argiope bruennichi]|uniref:Retrovirus-related Pol polyprotein like n=1 Tax=Argiope bruennichi TaxID=94029 RepID=A0A8T0EFC0_ARGBR|nr:Retrovirus-related Pol polyprotein like [Argiope bruennichi]